MSTNVSITVNNWIGGHPHASGQRYAVTDPATLETVAEAPLCTVEDVDAAVAAARRAAPGWGADPAARRAAMAAMANVIDAHIDELALLLSREQGKPVLSAAGEFRNAQRILRHYAAWEEQSHVLRDTPANSVRVVRAPLGVAGLIVPWNVPITLLHMKLAPALAAGNAVVVKPAPTTPVLKFAVAAALRGRPFAAAHA